MQPRASASLASATEWQEAPIVLKQSFWFSVSLRSSGSGRWIASAPRSIADATKLCRIQRVRRARHTARTRAASSLYSDSGRSFSRSTMAAGWQAAISSMRLRKPAVCSSQSERLRVVPGAFSRHRLRLVKQRISDIQIVVQHRLQAFTRHIPVHGIKASGIADFKLFITFCCIRILTGILAFVVSDAG